MIDPGKDAKLIGIYEGLTFELDRSLLEKLDGDFVTPKPEAPPVSMPPGRGFPPGFGQ